MNEKRENSIDRAWELFRLTGHPAAYALYRRRRQEDGAEGQRGALAPKAR